MSFSIYNCTKLAVLYDIDIRAYKNIPIRIKLPPVGIEPRTFCVAFRYYTELIWQVLIERSLNYYLLLLQLTFGLR